VGPVQETKGITGLARLFEHMAFKGSDRLGTSNYKKERAALEEVDRAFLALREERRKGAKADPETPRRLTAAFQAAHDKAGQYVVRNEFGEAGGGAGPTRWELRLAASGEPQAVLQVGFARGIRLRGFQQSDPTLHEVFVHLVGPEARGVTIR
jgi:hypothetical protein